MPNTSEEREVSTLDSSNLLVLLYKWRKPLIIVCGLAAVISALASFIIKEKYKSSVTVFAEQQHSLGAYLLEYVQNDDMLTYGGESDTERIMQLINSDEVRNKIINKYRLWEVYGVDTSARGSKALITGVYRENIDAEQTKFGSVQVTVLDSDPKRACGMANDIIAFSDSLANEMLRERAIQAYKHAENSLNIMEAEVKVLEDSMNVMQEMGVYGYMEQIEALTEQYGTAIVEGYPDRAQKIKDQMDFLSIYGTVYHKLQVNIDHTYGKLGVLRKRYDLMKIDTDSYMPIMRIVDNASVADKKSYPIRWLIVAMSTASAFVFGVVFLLLWDNIKRLRVEGRV